jgi:membrane-associated PAP2 superfamily phosphatase
MSRSSTLTGLAATVAVAVLFRNTDADVALQAFAFSPVEPQWPHAARQPWTVLHDFGTLPGLLFAIAAIAGSAASFLHERFLRLRYPALYVLALTALGPGLITNVFGKILAGRPRPNEVIPFGGTIGYLDAFDFGMPGKGFSFLCGHCSMAFLFFALFFLLRGWKRWAALVFAAIFGILLGIGRVVQAAHFPSDVLLGGTLMFTLAAALSPMAHIRASPLAATSRRKVVAAATAVTIVLVTLFLFSMPIHKERTRTWLDGVKRKAATDETVHAWRAPDAPGVIAVDVERGDVTVRFAEQPEPLVIRSLVNGYGFPGTDGRTSVRRDGASLRYEHRLERGHWEIHATFDVCIRPGTTPLVLQIRTGRGEIHVVGDAGLATRVEVSR